MRPSVSAQYEAPTSCPESMASYRNERSGAGECPLACKDQVMLREEFDWYEMTATILVIGSHLLPSKLYLPVKAHRVQLCKKHDSHQTK